MNKRSLTQAVIIGIALGILVFHPFWVSLHALDGLHDENISMLDFAVMAYREVFSFEHFVHTIISIFAGIIVSVLVLMMRVRKKQKNTGSSQ